MLNMANPIPARMSRRRIRGTKFPSDLLAKQPPSKLNWRTPPLWSTQGGSAVFAWTILFRRDAVTSLCASRSMKPVTRQDRLRLIVAVAVLVALLLAGIILAAMGYLSSLWSFFSTAFENRDSLRNYLGTWGGWAPLVFIGIQALQVLIAPIPGELTGAVGGFLFGAPLNIVYSSVGLTVGSVLAFLASRIIGLPLVKLVVKEETLEKFHFLTEPKGEIATLVFFIIPGFPKDILSYLLGLSPMPLLTFAVVCALGRIPGTVLLSVGGAALYKPNWVLLAVLGTACLVVFAIAYLKRDAIMAWIHRRHPRD
jgi:uncharacterized membrane protein YdjX (TVP38/TMEM64 family)